MSLKTAIDSLATRIGVEIKAVRGQVVKTVTVVTGSEARPTTSEKVFWVGGTTEPTNMAVGDVWLKAS